MAQRQHHSPISLFPFLAVLVCAMGALILLLLVITRQIREEQRYGTLADRKINPAEVSPPGIAARSEILLLPEQSAVAAPEPDSPIAAPPEATLTADTAADDEARDVQSRIDEVNVRITGLETAHQQLMQRIAELEQHVQADLRTQEQLRSAAENAEREIKRLQAGTESIDLPAERQQVVDMETARQQLQLRATAVAEQLRQKQQQLSSLTIEAERAEKKLFEQRSALLHLRKQVQHERQQAAATDGHRTVIAFSNSTGTTRTPIAINVTDAGYEFLPTGIRITSQEMMGFPIRDNPLLTGVLTLHQHRSGGSVVSQPYVLLLVRPDGSLPFYAAQRVLSEAGIHYGYELLDQDMDIAFGPRDDAEIRLVREALLETLSRRNTLHAMLRQQGVGAGGPDPDDGSEPDQRRLVLRSDGRVLTADESDRRPLEGKFYAGGEAPPRTLYRPPAGMPADTPSRHHTGITPRAGTTQPAGETPTTAPHPGSGPSTAEVVDRLSLPENGNAAFESLLNERLPTEFNRRSDAGDRAAAAATEMPIASSAAAAAPEMEKFTASEPLGAAHSKMPAGLTAFADAGADAESPVDLTKIDAELLRLLKTEAGKRREISSPVGITVFLDPEFMTIGQQPAVHVTSDSLGKAFARLLSGISDEVAASRRSPQEPLLPIVKFVVSPGAEHLRIPLARELQKIGIPSAMVIELSPYVTPVDDVGRTAIRDTRDDEITTPVPYLPAAKRTVR